MASAMCKRLMRRASFSSSSFPSSSSSLRSAVARTDSASSSPTCYRINSATFPPPNRFAHASLRFESSSRPAAELGVCAVFIAAALCCSCSTDDIVLEHGV